MRTRAAPSSQSPAASSAIMASSPSMPASAIVPRAVVAGVTDPEVPHAAATPGRGEKQKKVWHGSWLRDHVGCSCLETPKTG